MFDIDSSVSGVLEVKCTSEIGTKYADGKATPINDTDSEISANMKGEISAKTGIGMDLGVKVLKVLNLTFGGEGGVQIKADSKKGVSTNKDEKHLCALCFDGKLNVYVQLNCSGKLANKKLFTLTFAKAEIPLATFYISFLNPTSDLEFGWGKCPHKQYLLTINVVDENEEPVGNARVNVSADSIGSTGGSTSDIGGKYTLYLGNGEYNVSVLSSDRYTITADSSKVVNINGKPSSVTLGVGKKNQEIPGTQGKFNFTAADLLDMHPRDVEKVLIDNGFSYDSNFYTSGDGLFLMHFKFNNGKWTYWMPDWRNNSSFTTLNDKTIQVSSREIEIIDGLKAGANESEIMNWAEDKGVQVQHVQSPSFPSQGNEDLREILAIWYKEYCIIFELDPLGNPLEQDGFGDDFCSASIRLLSSLPSQ